MELCLDCQNLDISYEWDGKDERPYYYCKYYKREVMKDQSACKNYGKLRIAYREEDTKCDKCELFNECPVSKLEVTSIEDSRSHYLPDYGQKCMKTCEFCKWHDDFSAACCNGKSIKVAEFTDNKDWCDEYEPREDGSDVSATT